MGTLKIPRGGVIEGEIEKEGGVIETGGEVTGENFENSAEGVTEGEIEEGGVIKTGGGSQGVSKYLTIYKI